MPEVIDLRAGDGEGPIWGTATEDLNATLLAWPAGHEVAEHVNDERDVLLIFIDGAARRFQTSSGISSLAASHATLGKLRPLR